MRARLVIASALVLTLSAVVTAFTPVHAQHVKLAQDEGGDEESEQRPAQPSEPSPSPTEEETGPPWTYQMARISLGLVALILLAVAATYYRLVIRRQRGEV